MSIGSRYQRGKPCVHCTSGRINRPHGLCWTCYYTPGVKERHAKPSPHGRRGVGLKAGPGPLPARATTAAPGTPEKLAVLAERAARGEQLFHPDDCATMDGTRPSELLQWPERGRGA